MPSRPAPCGRAECRFGKRVVSRGIQGDYCWMWYHFSCAGINEKEATRLGRSDDVFSGLHVFSCSSRGETNTTRSPNNILDLLKKTRTNVVKFIPKASRRHFAKLLKDCLCQVVASPEDEFNWVRLFLQQLVAFVNQIGAEPGNVSHLLLSSISKPRSSRTRIKIACSSLATGFPRKQ